MKKTPQIPNPVIGSNLNLDLLKAKPIDMPSPLVTIQKIPINKDVTPPVHADKPRPTQKANFAFINKSAASGGGIPPAAPLAYVSEEFQPAVGVYIVVAPNRSGKTILTCGIAAWANDEGTPCTYSSVFEPRSFLGRTADKGKFRIPQNFVADATKSIAPLVQIGGRNQYKIVIYDSATLPMKAYASVVGENQATFPGGSQPSDRAFLDAMSQIANDKGACIMLVLNSTLIPYSADFEGAVEGIITVKSVNRFSVSDRTTFSSRRTRDIVVPDIYVDAALRANNYGPFTKSSPTIQGLDNRSGMYYRK